MSSKWVTVTKAEEVTPDILEAAESIFDGWYADEARIDWTDLLDRLEGAEYVDLGGRLDLGDSMSSPAVLKIKAHIRAYREQG
jgi:hypothetical protein